MTVILVAVGSRTTPKLVLFKTSTFQQLQCLFLHKNLLIFPQCCFFVGHLKIDACLPCISDGEGLIVCFEGHLYKLLVSENHGFIQDFKQVEIIIIWMFFRCFVNRKKVDMLYCK